MTDSKFLYGKVRRGEEHHAAKLDAKTVKAMREMHEEEKLCKRCVAIVFNVNYQTCFDVLTYRTWKHVL